MCSYSYKERKMAARIFVTVLMLSVGIHSALGAEFTLTLLTEEPQKTVRYNYKVLQWNP